jgi:hypothetical protein
MQIKEICGAIKSKYNFLRNEKMQTTGIFVCALVNKELS